MRLLYIEDERALADAVAYILRQNQYQVDMSFDGEDGLEQALTGAHDIIIIDLMLPIRDGFSVLKEFRAAGFQTPVILLTARDQVEDKVHGLDSGADDYLTKPFQMAELMARLRALSRRPNELVSESLLVLGDLEFEPADLTLRQGGYSCSLTPKEAQLLEILMRNANTTLSTQSILDRLWGYDADASQQLLQTYVSFLRKKLELFDTTVSIKTVRGIGYRLTDDTTLNGEFLSTNGSTPTNGQISPADPTLPTDPA